MERPVPTLDHERRLWQAGYRCVAGIDEAGRGALAGPVVAAAVVVAPEQADALVWTQVRDSKLLSPVRRAALAPVIKATAHAWAIGWCAAEEIDHSGIAVATRRAMMLAVQALSAPPNYLLIDWVRLPALVIPQHSQAKADSEIVSVAAASILAKVFRDRCMVELDAEFPYYGFARHKGYGAAAHLAALHTYGPCRVHRRSFAPLATPSLFDLKVSG